MTIFGSIVEDEECASPRNQLEIMERPRRRPNKEAKRFPKVCEPYIWRYGDEDDGGSSRQCHQPRKECRIGMGIRDRKKTLTSHNEQAPLEADVVIVAV